MALLYEQYAPLPFQRRRQLLPSKGGSFTSGELAKAGLRYNGQSISYAFYAGAAVSDFPNLAPFTAYRGTAVAATGHIAMTGLPRISGLFLYQYSTEFVGLEPGTPA